MKHLIASALLIISSLAHADCEDKVPYGMPQPSEETTQLCRKQYVVKFYNSCKVPLFVAQYIDPKQLGGSEPRESFRADPEVPEQFRATPKDYVKSGYDKGHMAPAADFQNDHVAMDESFLLSNAVPQSVRLNRGIWRSIEIRARALAVKHDGIYVFTGGVFDPMPKVIGNGVCIPAQTFKVIIDPKTQQSIGYLVPNKKTGLSKDIKTYQVPVSTIEDETGIDFTPALIDPPFKKTIGVDLTTPR